MLEKLKSWFKGRFSDEDLPKAPDRQFATPKTAPPTVRPKQKIPRRTPEFVDTDDELAGEIESHGPGKNVLIRNKFVREDTGTHETLKILDDSLVDSGEETGIDPYNTGEFDRSKNWDRRFGK